MSRHQEIAFGQTGQRLRLNWPNEMLQAISAVTVYEAQNSDDSPLSGVTTGSASLVEWGTTTDEAAGPSQADPTRIGITGPEPSAGDLQPGDIVQIGPDPNQEGEMFMVERVDLGDYIYAQQPLARDHISGSYIGTTWGYISIDSTWVADDANILNRQGPDYRVKWEFTDRLSNTQKRVAYTYFSLVREPAIVQVAHFDVDAVVPGYTTRLAINHQSDKGKAALRAAHASVGLDCRMEGFDLSSIRDDEVVNELVVRRFIWDHEVGRLLAGGGDFESVELARQMYQSRFDSFIKHPSRTKVDVDSDNDGAGTAKPPTRISRL